MQPSPRHLRNRHLPRRSFLQASAATAASLLAAPHHVTALNADDAKTSPEPIPQANTAPTRFQLACMTLPYAAFPLQRAFTGIQAAGYKHIAWGTTHREADQPRPVPVMPVDAPVERAKDLAKRCRDLGLNPVMMFSTIYPEHNDAIAIFTHRIKQAHAAGIAQVLTFGHTKGGNHALWITRFKQLAPIAADHNITLVIKQHGGDTGTGEACAKITREINHPHIKVNYDAGNVMDYLNVDPIPDIKLCAADIRSLCIKDHRNFPKDEDCGPGLGEIDHYKLLHPIMHTGLTMPLAFENINAPLLPRPDQPERVDTLATRAREFIETVIMGLGGKIV